MANSRHITRRAALVGFVTSAAATVPAAYAVSVAEEPNAKVRRLQRELSDALAELQAAPAASGDYVSIVYPTGTVDYARTLIDRDVFESTRDREILRGRAIDVWRQSDNALTATLSQFDRTRWELAKLDENEARTAMLRVFRSL